LPFDDAATESATTMALYRWDPSTKKFSKSTLRGWLDGPEHLLSALLLLGEGGKGKSKLMHTLAQEVCIAYDKPSYLYGKNVDALGILSYAGEVRKAAVLMLTDCDLKIARGGNMGSEALKSLLDVTEGGSIQDTRYRPASFPPGLVRILAFNGDAKGYGDFFTKYEQYGIAAAIQALSEEDGEEKATKVMLNLSSDDQAAARRVSIALCIGEEDLIKAETKLALMAATTSKAKEAHARREAYWAAQRNVA